MRWRFWGTPPGPATTPDTIEQLDVLTSAATQVSHTKSSITPQYESWQREAWAYYDELGEFRFAVDWKAEMVSRVRLRAGRRVPGQDEPELLDDGPAADLIDDLAGGPGGQSEMMASLATQINVPGEGYVVGETTSNSTKWSVLSSDEIRKRASEYEIIDAELSTPGKPYWRRLAADSLVVRVWRPHKRMRYVADSPARSMRSTMREIELVNRKIQAQYLSRLTSAGVFLIAAEVDFPVREEFADEPDPFVAEWIETAKEAIANPGNASATIPIPMRVPAEYVEKGFKFIDFSIKDDEKIVEKRESAIRRLATQADVPAEILLGMGDVNHWSAWQLEESAIKTHISTDVEVIVHALTIGYLWPRLKAMGAFEDDLVVWYDTSELTLRPDRSEAAGQAHDRFAISDQAYLREIGLDEGDVPTLEELKTMILRRLSTDPMIGLEVLAELTNDAGLSDIVSPPPTREPTTPDGDTDDANDGRTPPDTRDEPPPTPGVDAASQARAPHRLHVGLTHWTLLHPKICRESTFTCPVAQASRHLSYLPGTTGDYEAWLSPQGELIVGRRTFESRDGFVSGHSRVRRLARNGSHSH